MYVVPEETFGQAARDSSLPRSHLDRKLPLSEVESNSQASPACLPFADAHALPSAATTQFVLQPCAAMTAMVSASFGASS